MRRLMDRVAEAVYADMDVLKGLKQLSEHLKASDTSPDETLLPEQANLLLEKLDVQMDINDDESLRRRHLLRHCSNLEDLGLSFASLKQHPGQQPVLVVLTCLLLLQLEKWLGSCKVGKWLQVLVRSSRFADR
ncbi:uncharacterized protein LOC110909240 [Helianthus annuus]|uniref:uncharacterized protein LOC110909240 n=1 Tax=Helianthus annuus TaxID=4232 RepID=UPI000B8F2293|nr:uncharacterized protein LOC110909240 [Helianthus annuus]